MTRQQYKICKYILKHDKLQDVCQKFGLDYLDLQYKLGSGSIDFSDSEMSETTTITLTDEIINEFEQYRDFRMTSVITCSVAIWGGITGTISLIADIVQAFL